jgi:hypothetical protein
MLRMTTPTTASRLLCPYPRLPLHFNKLMQHEGAPALNDEAITTAQECDATTVKQKFKCRFKTLSLKK